MLCAAGLKADWLVIPLSADKYIFSEEGGGKKINDAVANQSLSLIF